MHGVFSRASRLSKEPNPDLAEPSAAAATPSVPAAVKSSSPKPLEKQLPNASSTPRVANIASRLPEKSRFVVLLQMKPKLFLGKVMILQFKNCIIKAIFLS